MKKYFLPVFLTIFILHLSAQATLVIGKVQKPWTFKCIFPGDKV